MTTDRMLVFAVATLLSASAQTRAQTAPVHHELRVELSPEDHSLAVTDSLRLRGVSLPARFTLHRELEITKIVSSVAEPITVHPLDDPGDGQARTYELRGTTTGDAPVQVTVELRYGGRIHHPLQTEEQEYARSFARTRGLIGPEGVMLSGSSSWVPRFGDALMTFRLTVTLPAGWGAVSQGARSADEQQDDRRRLTWDCAQPMDEVYLIAGRWTEYQTPVGAATAMAFLRTPDEALATRYLDATGQYLAMYADLIGPYPYAKFALVENFWETGYGMPSFTLLGPQVIRLPFILHTSYPHEILHNWWGNGVFVDYERGNWCEGLTAYLADHLLAEGQGRGAEYRRDTLKRYRNYVRAGEGTEFPLRAFRGRHSSSSEAIGYGKALMLFHMLRQRLGDDAFRRGLRTIYSDLAFQRAAFEDLEQRFSRVAGEDLAPWFAQWVERTGAPEIALGYVAQDGDALLVTVEQTQPGGLYALRVPVAVHLRGADTPLVQHAELTDRAATVRFALPATPELVQVDPGFDVFRRLHRAELPPTIGQLFGADRVTLIVPADDPLGDAWSGFARAWTGSEGSDVRVVRDTEIESLPADGAVWVLGAGNRWAQEVAGRVASYGARVGAERIAFGTAEVARADHCFVLTAPHPGDEEAALGWVGADDAAALPGLARKLPHYGKYSYLAFAGPAPTNDAKGAWATLDSPLQRRFGAGPAQAPPLPVAEPLARPARR